jgi:LuxR family maltose regulon positive regulatory protein
VETEQAHPVSICRSRAEELLAAARFGIPGPVASHVHRPRLLDAFAGAKAVPLVLVSGPAGTGKTSVVAEWVRETAETGTTGWISFEDGETAFWAHLVECLTRLGLDVPSLSEDHPADAALGRQRLTALAGAIADQPERRTVVLDGYELVSLEIAQEVEFLLRHTSGRLCLVFVGRVDPALPLYRYRLSESLLEVRAADLAFTDEEAAQLLRVSGVSLSRESVRELNERVKGWAAGLRFAAKALAGSRSPAASVATVVSQTCDINEYLVGEVLDAHTPEVRRFLLDTCVPEVLCPALVEELSGPQGLHTLEEVARSNAFIEPVPDQPGSYRYYPFFRDLLRAQLAYEDPKRMEALHRRASRWFSSQGLSDRSIGHLAATGAWDEVADEIVTGPGVGRLLLEGADGPLAMAARQVPADLEQSSACLVRAVLALVGDDPARCAQELSGARRTAVAGSASSRVLHASIVVVDAVRACLTDPAESAAAVAGEARRALHEGQLRPRGTSESELYALAQLSTGVAMLRCGDLEHARKALTIAVGLDPARRFARFRSDCLGYLAVVDALEGHLARATRGALESKAAATDAGVPVVDRPAAAQVALAKVAYERYELRAARDHVASAIASRSLQGDPVARSLIEGVVAGLERASGHLQSGLARLESAATRAAPTDPWLADGLRLEAAKLSVASGRATTALHQLEGVGEGHEAAVEVVAAAALAEHGDEDAATDSLARARTAPSASGTEVMGLLVEVLQESKLRSPTRARVVLDRSLRLAAPEMLRRPFHEAGPAVQRLLSADQRLLREHPWLSRSGSPSGSRIPAQRTSGEQALRPAPPTLDVIEPLTAKELEVLGHLEELLTTEEIAEKMFVSVNTVRTHVRSILRKLGVNRRNAAVRKARDLGLFDA